MAGRKLKRLDKKKFEDALNGYLNGKYIQLEAAKIAGCNRDFTWRTDSEWGVLG